MNIILEKLVMKQVIINRPFRGVNLSILLVLFSCVREEGGKTSMEEASEKGVERNKSLDTLEKVYFESGTLERIGRFSKDGVQIGYINIYDEQGNLFRKSKYGWNGVLKNSLVENIQYDSLGNVNFENSFFLETLPNAVDDTIYFSNEKSSRLELKAKFHSPTSHHYELVVNKNDTLQSKNGEWLSIPLEDLDNGVMELYFFIEVIKSDSLSSLHESRRFLKVG